MNTEIKKYADCSDIKSLKYIFVDALDVDPTFVRYEEEYNYCKSIPGLLETHVDITPFRTNKIDWTEEYWISLKMDLIKNFSDRRMSHMREVAKIFLADKVQRILTERASYNSDQTVPITKVAPVQVATEKLTYLTPKSTEAIKKTSKADEQARQLEEEKYKLAAENKARDQIEIETKKHTVQLEQQCHKKEHTTQVGGEFPKKLFGIAIAAITVIVILFLILK